MAKYQLRSFKDIVDAVVETLKIQSTDTESRRRIKRNINQIYLDEVIPFKRWSWLRGYRTLQNTPYFQLGTASVTQNAVAVTLTMAPPNSVVGQYFAVNDGDDVYRVSAHTAGSLTLTLETPYSGATLYTAGFKIWSDAIPLPTDCKEIEEVTSQRMDRPLQNYGQAEYRRITASGLRSEGLPQFYTTSSYKDPLPYVAIALPASLTRSSSGLIKTVQFSSNVNSVIEVGDNVRISTGGHYSYNIDAVVSTVNADTITYTATVPLTEAATTDVGITVARKTDEAFEAYRELIIHPSCYDRRFTLHVDYQLNAEPLEEDTDEPLIPAENRMVLYYGAMWLACSRERNPEWAQENRAMFDATLARMAGKNEDAPEKPVIKPSNLYLGSKRMGVRTRGTLGTWSSNDWGGGGGPSTPTGTPNTLAIFGEDGTLQANSEVELSSLNLLQALEAGLTATLLASQGSPVVIDTFLMNAYRGAHIMIALVRDGTSFSGSLYITSNGTVAALSGPVGAGIGTTGIDFQADLSGGNLSLTYTSDGSGGNASLRYLVILL